MNEERKKALKDMLIWLDNIVNYTYKDDYEFHAAQYAWDWPYDEGNCDEDCTCFHCIEIQAHDIYLTPMHQEIMKA